MDSDMYDRAKTALELRMAEFQQQVGKPGQVIHIQVDASPELAIRIIELLRDVG